LWEFKEKTCLSRKYFYLDKKLAVSLPAHIANVIIGPGAVCPGTRLTVFFIQVDFQNRPTFVTTEDSVLGRMLVFFRGEYTGNVYRFMDARDGFNYMAVPITGIYGAALPFWA
jgi:hypothetical protein